MFLTVCIPVYNEEKNITTCVNSVLNDLNTIEQMWEVILCLSGCTDQTETVVRDTYSDHERIEVIIEQQRTGKANAVNLLVERASGNHLIFIDSDIILKPGSMKALLSGFHDDKTFLTAGRLEPIIDRKTLFDSLNRLSLHYWHQFRLNYDQTDMLWSICGQLYCIKKEHMPEIPISIVNEDAYIGSRVIQCGGRVKYVPDAVAYIDYPHDLSSYFRQKIRTRAGWHQIKQETQQDVSRIYEELKRLAHADFRSANLKKKLHISILLALNELLFLIGRIRFMRTKQNELVLWKRIEQDLSHKD